MKKIISVLLIFSLIFSMTGIVMADSEKSYDEYDMQISFLKELGVIDTNSDYSDIRTLTRGEFSVYAAKLLGESVIADDTDYFWDVDADSEFGRSIGILVEAGCVSGDPSGAFRPGDYIAPAEAVTILVNMLGFGVFAKAEGGYPYGYYRIADRIGLTGKGFSTNATTFQSLATLLYNALHIPTLDVTSLTTNNIAQYETQRESNGLDKTLLSRYFNIYRTEGIFESTSTASLDFNKIASDETVTIGGGQYFSDSRFDRYLGYDVNLWFKETDRGNSVFFVYPGKRNNELTLDADTDVSLKPGEIRYSPNGKMARKKLSTDVSIIYNNGSLNLLEDFDDSLFSIDDGYIKLIDNDNNGEIDVIKIVSYVNLVIESIIIDDELVSIYGAFGGSNIPQMDISETSYSIRDSMGRDLTFDDLQHGDIISVAESKDRKNVEILVSYSFIDGKISGIETDEEKIQITLNGNTYTVLNSAITKDIVLNMNTFYTFYINSAGYIVALSENKNDGMEYGYMLGVYQEGASRTVSAYYINSANERVTSQIIKNAKIDGVKLKNNDKIIDTFKPAVGEKYVKLTMRYRLNNDGFISEIDTGRTYNAGVESPNSLRLRYDSAISGAITYEGGNDTFRRFWKYYYDENETRRVGDMYGYASSNIIFVSEPPVAEGEEDIDVSEVTVRQENMLTSKASVNVELYSTDPYGNMLSMIVVKSGSATSTVLKDELYIVTKKKMKLDSDGETRLCFTIDNGATSRDVFLTDEDKFIKSETNASTGEGGVEDPNDVNIGDVIRIATDFKGNIAEIYKVYDYKNDELLAYTSYFRSENRVFGGWVYNMDGKYASIAVADKISDVVSSNGSVDETMMELHMVPKAISYDVDQKQATVTNVPLDKIIDYKTGGEDCDRLLIRMANGSISLKQVIKLPIKSKRR